MSAHQRLFVLERPREGRRRRALAEVAERDARVAQQPGVLRAQDGPPGEAEAELRFGERQQRDQIRKRGFFVRGGEFCQPDLPLRLVHRARLLAEVAAENPVAHASP